MKNSVLMDKFDNCVMKNSILMNKYDNYVKKFIFLEECRSQILDAINSIITCYENNGKLLICGNGGSTADAEHITGELMKGFLKKRPLHRKILDKANLLDGYDLSFVNRLQSGLPTINLCVGNGLITAIANDIGADLIYAQQVMTLARENDLLLVLSTSGCSKNIVNAALAAKVLNIKCIGLTGEYGGNLNEVCDILVKVPSNETARIQEMHVVTYHIICELLEEYFY